MTGWGAPGSAANDTRSYSPYGQSPFSSGLSSPMWPPDPTSRLWTCWCAVHRPASTPYNTVGDIATPRRNLVVMEFEFEKDIVNPLYPPMKPMTPAASAGSTSRYVQGMTQSTHGFNSNISSSSYGGSSSGFSSSDSSDSATSNNASDSTLVSVANPPELTPTNSSNTIQASATFAGAPPPSLGSLSPLAANLELQKTSGNDIQSLEQSEQDGPWEPSAEDVIESTTSRAKPVLALERLRRVNRLGAIGGEYYAQESEGTPMKRFAKRAAATASGDIPAAAPVSTGMMDVFTVISQINEQLGAADDLDTFLKVVVGVIKDLTQFHRVLVYQFDEACNGQVVAELVDWSQTQDLFRGLHFPKGDIPQQARELYMISTSPRTSPDCTQLTSRLLDKVRMLYDRSQPTARIVVRSKEDLDEPLNMTYCYLRAMSPIHIKCMSFNLVAIHNCS